VLIPRHRFYTTLLLLNLLLMVVGIGLPPAHQNLIRPGYMLMGLLLLLGLGGRPPTRLSGWRIYVFPLLGVTTLAVDLLWWITPLRRFSGLPLLLMWICFVAIGVSRLVVLLGKERRVNWAVLQGALAGYLLLGITSGLLMTVLETVHPGSFTSLHHQLPVVLRPTDVDRLRLDFTQLNYFAFECLTTVGFGDIAPVSSWARVISVGVAMVGPLYIAVVMGVLISRITASQTTKEVEEFEEQRDLLR
jgi:hypothetical protein